MLRNILDNITTTETDKKLATFAEKSADTLNEIKDLDIARDGIMFGYLESITNNLDRLAIHFTGMADSVDKMNKYMSVFSKASMDAFEEEKRQRELAAAKSETDLEADKGTPADPESMLDRVMGRIMGLFALVDLLLPFVYGFLEKVFGKTGAIAAIGAFLLLQIGVVRKIIGETFRFIVGVFDDILRAASKIPGKIGKFFTSIFDVFKDLFKGMKELPLKKILSKALKVIPVIGSLIAAAIDGTVGAIEGFEEGGAQGAVRGALAGIITGLVGWIGDFATWIVGNFLKFLGFEELGEQIASFDFSGLVSDSVKWLFDTIVDYITSLVDIVKSVFSTIADIGMTIVDSIKRLMSGEDLATVLFDALKSIFATVVDGITTIGGEMAAWLPGGKTIIDNLNATRESVGLPALEGGSTPEEKAAQAAAIANPGSDAAMAMSRGMGEEMADGSGFWDGGDSSADGTAQTDHDNIMAKRARVEGLIRRGAPEEEIMAARTELAAAVDAAQKSGSLEHMGVEDRAEDLKVVAAPKATAQAATESRARSEANDAKAAPAQQTAVNAINAPSMSQSTMTNNNYSGNAPRGFGVATA